MNNIQKTPFLHVQNYWYYGFIALELPNNKDDCLTMTQQLNDFFEEIANGLGEEFGHNVLKTYELSDRGDILYLKLHANLKSMEFEVLTKLKSVGYEGGFLLKPQEQDMFLNNNTVSKAAINRVFSANNNPETENIQKSSLTKSLEKLNTTIVD